MINSFKQFIELALNKNQMGKPSPSEFNHAVAQSIQKNYSNMFADLRKLNYRKSRFQDTPNYGNEAEYIKQAQEYYIKEESVPLTAGKAQMPDDFYLLNTVYSDKAEVEKNDLRIFNTLKRNPKLQPTTCSPICTYNDGELKVFPLLTTVDVTYFREPKMPKWTYRIIGGKESFDQSQPDYQDLDIHPIMYDKLFVDTLGLLGLNIRDEFASQYVAQMKQKEMIASQ